MSDKLKAVEDIKKLAKSLKGIVALADDLESLGSMEQAIRETVQRLDAWKAEEAKALELKSKAECDLESAYNEARAVSANAKEAADRMYSNTKSEVQGLLDAAKEEARIMISEALAAKDQVEKEAAKVKGDLNAVVEEIAKKQAALQDLNSQIEMIRKKVN